MRCEGCGTDTGHAITLPDGRRPPCCYECAEPSAFDLDDDAGSRAREVEQEELERS